MILALVFPVSVRKPKAAVGTEWVWMLVQGVWKGILGLWAEGGKEAKPQHFSSKMFISKSFQIKGTA